MMAILKLRFSDRPLRISLFGPMLILYGSLIFLASCNNEKKSVSHLDIDHFHKTEGQALQNKIRSIDLIAISDTITKISRVQKISTSEKHNYILSGGLRSIINIFTKEWKFLGRISQYGISEGQFQEITDFCHTSCGDTVFVLDYLGMKVLAFSCWGDFIFEKSIEIAARQFTFQDGHFIFYTKKFPNFGSHYSEIIVTDSTFEVVKDYFPIKETKPVRYSSSSVFSFSESAELIFSNSFRDTVFHLTNKKIRPYVILDMKNGISTSQIKSRFHLDSIIKTGDFFYDNFLISKNYYAFTMANRMALNTYIYNRTNAEAYYTNGFNLLPGFYIGNPIGLIDDNLIMALPATVVYEHEESWIKIMESKGSKDYKDFLHYSDNHKNDILISISLI